MKTARPNITSRTRRRGVTLLEMLVTVALLLLMMSIIVAVFQTATGSITVSKAYALLEQEQRRLNTIIRQDLAGVTCSMTPPNNPVNNAGYFEYAENALSDAQDEDTDDTLRFTAKAPDGRPFTGRIWVPKTVSPLDPGYAGARSVTLEPVPVTSQYAEIIYFLRGDKLYRRVRLILPQQTLNIGNQPSDPNVGGGVARTGPQRFGFATNLFEPIALFRPITIGAGAVPTLSNGIPFVSWQGLNDISARPSVFDPANVGNYTPIPNTLGDLTDRHNRFANPRFANDYRNNTTGNNPTGMGTPIPDGLPDDMNGDGVFDYYPTLYSSLNWNSKFAMDPYGSAILNDSFANDGSFGTFGVVRPLNPDIASFPYVFPVPFSKGIQPAAGLLHSLDPSLNSFNHNPLETGDSLPVPNASANGGQTWWALPTWRETMAPTWLDPIKRINDPAGAPFFSDPIAMALNEQPGFQTIGLSPTVSLSNSPVFLPAQPGPFSDNVPGTSQLSPYDLTTAPVFEDDLIAVNVRSFNIKGFDPNPRFLNPTTNVVTPLLPGYYDLGYASGLNPALSIWTPPYMLDTLGHEGRMPPLPSPVQTVGDNRVDPQFPTYDFTPVPASGIPTLFTVPSDIGDANPTLIRIRRTWDSWSTTYTNAPALPLNPGLPYPYCGPQGGYVPGDTSLTQSPPQPPVIARGRSIIPSYPAPYAVPLRGIEIQIRLTDPENRHVKTLTIHQDFSDKL